MITTLIWKELRFLIQSPKYVASFIVGAVLLLLSVLTGIREYQVNTRQYEEMQKLRENAMQEVTQWFQVPNQVIRKPDPLQIFVTGTHNDIGRFSNVNAWSNIDLESSVYMEDTLFATFRFVDFMFIVQVVLALFAILFTYDAITGERQRGTLQLTLSNPVPRTHYLIAKFVGSWSGLVVPLLIPILLSLLLIQLFNIPFSVSHWARLGTIIGFSIVYVSFFLTLGIFVSSLTRRSNVSFLILLSLWVFFVLIIPRTGVMIAAQIIRTPSVAEIESLKQGYARTQREAMRARHEQIMSVHLQKMQNMTEAERELYRDEQEWGWMQEIDKAQKEMQADIATYERSVDENVNNRRRAQEALAFRLSRFSPASIYSLAVLEIAGTGASLKATYQRAMEEYRSRFISFIEEKQGSSQGGFVFRIGNASGHFTPPETTLDLAEMPQFQPPVLKFRDTLRPALLDLILLLLATGLCITGSFMAFNRYDVRV